MIKTIMAKTKLNHIKYYKSIKNITTKTNRLKTQ